MWGTELWYIGVKTLLSSGNKKSNVPPHRQGDCETLIFVKGWELQACVDNDPLYFMLQFPPILFDFSFLSLTTSQAATMFENLYQRRIIHCFHSSYIRGMECHPLQLLVMMSSFTVALYLYDYATSSSWVLQRIHFHLIIPSFSNLSILCWKVLIYDSFSKVLLEKRYKNSKLINFFYTLQII